MQTKISQRSVDIYSKQSRARLCVCADRQRSLEKSIRLNSSGELKLSVNKAKEKVVKSTEDSINTEKMERIEQMMARMMKKMNECTEENRKLSEDMKKVERNGRPRELK